MESSKFLGMAEKIYSEGDLSTLGDKLRIERIIGNGFLGSIDYGEDEDKEFLINLYEENFGYGYS